MKCREYLEWVAGQRCCDCGRLVCEAHHIKGVAHLSGLSMKCTDLAAMPLCHGCHAAQHAHPDERQIGWAFATLDRAVEEGVLVVKNG